MELLKKIESVRELFQAGLWSSDTELSFCIGANLAGSRVTKGGTETISVRSLDSVLQGKRASFIKMDIEGSELEALKGAEETIRKWRPKLAISMYHKPEDIWELPLYVKKLVPDYRLYLRHHSNAKWDFVLYAV